MLRLSSEPNWAIGVFDLGQKCSLSLSDTNIQNMASQMWKSLVRKQAFSQLSDECSTNAKARHVAYGRLQNLLGLQVVRVLFRGKLLIFDLKSNFKRSTHLIAAHFVELNQKTFDHLFKCTDGLYCPQSLKDVTLQNLADTNGTDILKQIGLFLQKSQKYSDVYKGS